MARILLRRATETHNARAQADLRVRAPSRGGYPHGRNPAARIESQAVSRHARHMKGNPPDKSTWLERYASVVIMFVAAFGSLGYFAWNIYA